MYTISESYNPTLNPWAIDPCWPLILYNICINIVLFIYVAKQ